MSYKLCIEESIKYSNKHVLSDALNKYSIKYVLKKALNTVINTC